MARTAVTTTSFTGETNGAHPSGFTDLSDGFGQVQVTSEHFHSPYGFDADSRDNGTFSDDQYFKFAVAAIGSGATVGIIGGLLRFGSDVGAGRDGYRVKLNQTNTSTFTVTIEKVVNGTPTTLATNTTTTFSVSDTFEGEAQGTTLRAMKNGVEILSVTDSTFSTGKPGLHAKAVSQDLLHGDTYEAGNGFLASATDVSMTGQAATLSQTKPTPAVSIGL